MPHSSKTLIAKKPTINLNLWKVRENSRDDQCWLKIFPLLYCFGFLCSKQLRMLDRHEKEKGVNIQVLLRCRPFSEDEFKNNPQQVVTCNDHKGEVTVSHYIAGKHFDRIFTFDKVFGPSAQQKDFYQQAIVPIVNEVLEGFNCTIFAYGQTGTGKTYTMEGECKSSKSCPNGELPREVGVVPRAVKQIFDTLESQNAEYSVKVTFLELYNEEIIDLLAPQETYRVVVDDKQMKQPQIMEDGKGGVFVRDLGEEIVTNASDIFTLLERASAKRRTAETLLSKESSRSHSLLSITIHIKEANPEGEELIKCGKLNLVDLAGSENIFRSGAKKEHAREAREINKSLLTLGRVINALVEHLGHIPYRDSKLTRLLSDSLGGRTKTCIIATVSPTLHCLKETLSTLDYAHRAKEIKNKPEVNQKMKKSILIKDLYGKIEPFKAGNNKKVEKIVAVPRKRLANISNVPHQPKLAKIVAKEQSLSFDTKQYIDELEKENMELIKLAADNSKIIESYGINWHKMQQQNLQMAMTNTQMLAELNSVKDRHKDLQHELGCKNGLIKAMKIEMEKVKIVTQCQACGTKVEIIKYNEVGDTSQAVADNGDDKPRGVKRRRLSNVQPFENPIVKLVEAKDSVDNKRRTSRRQFARFKSQGKPQEIRRSPRQATKKVHSYTEIPLNKKMRRPE